MDEDPIFSMVYSHKEATMSPTKKKMIHKAKEVKDETK
jgi:hypothetical protein